MEAERIDQIGTVPTYNTYGNRLEWLIFQDQLDNFLFLNNITDVNRKISFLLLSIDEEIYRAVKWISWPNEPAVHWRNKYVELCDVINGQFPAFKSLTEAFGERLIFYAANQQDGETVTQWFDRIRKLSMNCKFGQFYESTLLDRFISGLKPSDVLDRLLAEQRLMPLKDVLKIALYK